MTSTIRPASLATIRLGSICGIAMFGALASTAPVSAAPNLTEVGSFFARDCVEVSAIVSVPPTNADAAVPDGYRASSFIGLPGGPSIPSNTSVLMGVETCQSGVIDGTEVNEPFSFGERVISIDRRDSTPGYHFYAVEQVSDNRHIVDMLSGAGFDATYVPGVNGTADARGGVSEGGTVRVVDDAPLPQLPSPLSTVSIWRETGASTSVLRLHVLNPTAQAGVGTVTARTGSPIAKLMGTETATGIGAINRFDFHAQVLTEG